MLIVLSHSQLVTAWQSSRYDKDYINVWKEIPVNKT